MTWRLILANRLELSRSRGVFWSTLALTVGAALLLMVVPELVHVARSATQPPAGGHDGLVRGLVGLGITGAVAGLLVGSYGGTESITSGVFRDLAATGRPRWALYGSRAIGTLIFFLPFVTVAYLAVVLFTIVFTGTQAQQTPFGAFAPPLVQSVPSASQFLQGYGWIVLFTCFQLLLAVGVGATMNSRASTVGILLAFEFIATPILANIQRLGDLRNVLFLESLFRLFPLSDATGFENSTFSPSVTSSVVVLAYWLVVALGSGALRTERRDL